MSCLWQKRGAFSYGNDFFSDTFLKLSALQNANLRTPFPLSTQLDWDDVCCCTMYDFHNSTDALKFWTEKWAFNKTFFVFHLILMKLGEVVVHMDNYNFTKIRWKTKKFYQ